MADHPSPLLFLLRSRLIENQVLVSVYAGQGIGATVRQLGDLTFSVERLEEWDRFLTTLTRGAEQPGSVVQVLTEGDREVFRTLALRAREQGRKDIV